MESLVTELMKSACWALDYLRRTPSEDSEQEEIIQALEDALRPIADSYTQPVPSHPYDVVSEFLDRHSREHPNQLPVILYKGKRYVIDVRLREWRNVENPFQDRIVF